MAKRYSLLIFQSEQSHQVLKEGTVKFASQKHESFACSGQGKEFYSPLVIINIGLLNISHEMRDTETKEHAVPLQRILVMTDVSITVNKLSFPLI